LTSPHSPSSLETWQKKLQYLQQQLAIASNAAAKFELEQQIKECQRAIGQWTPETSENSPNNLPGRRTPYFVGRETQLEELHQILQKYAICAVAGMGGIGKTELALQYGRQYQPEYGGGICWVDCRGVTAGIQIMQFAESRLHLSIPSDRELADRVADCWRRWPEGKALIIYDDVEDYRAIEPYLPPDNLSFTALLTTRLNLGGIENFPLDVLSIESSLELLRDWIGDKRVMREENTAKELCDRLGYLPLALTLVGHYLQKQRITFAEMLMRLEEKGLEHRSLTVDPKDKTWTLNIEKGVKAAFEVSWQELSEEARELGDRLSCFAPSAIDWTWIEALDTGCDRESLGDLRVELENLSLLRYDPETENFYSLHPLIREFFLGKLKESDRALEYQRDFCRVMLEIARKTPPTVTQQDITSLTPVIPHLKEIATRFIDAVAEEDVLLPSTALGRFYQEQSIYLEAEFWCTKSIETTKQRFGENHPSVATSYNNLAELYRVTGRYGEADPLYRKALEICLEQLGENHPSVATLYNNLALLYSFKGRYGEAEPLFRKSLELRLEQLGENHPDVATSYNNLATLYRVTSRYGEAESLYGKALEIRLEKFGKNHPSVATSYNNLAGLYQATSRYGEAELLFRKALEIRLEQLGENHPDVAASYNNLASLYQSTRRYGEAEPLFRKAMETLLEKFGKNHPYVASSYNNLAYLYESTGRYGEAEPLYQKALEIARDSLGENHPNTVTFYNNYLTMLRQAPLEELLAIVPLESHESLRQLRQSIP
jgi:tetratricopeptide (TPR) repeat protein